MDCPTKPFPDTTLAATRLACERGFQTLFENLDFETSSGYALQIAGANGVGKTSLLRIMATLGLAAGGDILWNNASIRSRLPAYRATIHYLGHKQGLKPDLTPEENLHFAAQIGGFPLTADWQPVDCLNRFEIGLREDRPIRQLSAGQQQRVALARLWLSDAPIWLMDEPATSLDQSAIASLTELMKQHLERNGLIIFTSHQAFDLPPAQFRVLTLTRS